MSRSGTIGTGSISARSYVNSDAFRTLFREGMTLVEETAAYLDGEGRDESRLISRDATLSYAAESMRLTTLLMQIASWLLVQRAVAEGEMTPARRCWRSTGSSSARPSRRSRRISTSCRCASSS